MCYKTFYVFLLVKSRIFQVMTSDELASSDDDAENNPSNSFGLPATKTVLSDHRQLDHTQYERGNKWLCFSHLKNGFMCKICTVFYGDSPCPEHTSRGAWSHKGIVFKKIQVKNYVNMGNQSIIKKLSLLRQT